MSLIRWSHSPVEIPFVKFGYDQILEDAASQIMAVQILGLLYPKQIA